MLGRLINTTHIKSRQYLKCCTQLRFIMREEQQESDSGELADPKTPQFKTNDVVGKYSKQDEDKILTILNNYNLNELLGYDISKSRANKLLAYRMKNGLLNNLNDILLVEGFGLKVTDKFYKSLLEEPKSADDIDLGKRTKQRTAPFITPSMEAEQQSEISSCVAVRIGVNSITWSRLKLAPVDSNEPCQLTHWQHHEISDKKVHINELIHRCLYVSYLIPVADCYLFENPQMAQVSNNPGSVDQQNINIQKAQVTAMMGFALAARNSMAEPNSENEEMQEKKARPHYSVFYVRRFLTARLFRHLVGTERISSEQTILNMMRTYYNTDEMPDFLNSVEDVVPQHEEKQKSAETRLTFRGNVQFPTELRGMFSKALRYHREFLGQALLLNLAFVRLVLLQDAESIAEVSRGGKTKSNDENLK